jgi:hypothetical protein
MAAAERRSRRYHQNHRSETANGRRHPGDGKRLGGPGEDSFHDPDRHHENRIHDFVLAMMIGLARSALGMVRIAGLAQERLSQRMSERVVPFPNSLVRTAIDQRREKKLSTSFPNAT